MFPQWSLSLRFPHQDPIQPLSSPIRATCPAHLILLHFITRTILGEQYKSFSSSLCNLLHSPSWVQIFSSTPCSQTPSASFPPPNTLHTKIINMIIEKDFTGLGMNNLSYKYFYRPPHYGLPRASLYKWHAACRVKAPELSCHVQTGLPLELKSSTNMISFNRWDGDLLMTLTAVLSSVLQCSLWNGTMTLIVGSCVRYFFSLHL